jgi:hypothetical protein
MKLNLFILFAVIMIPSLSFGSDVTIPNTFETGTIISSSEMNANFSAFESAVDDNDARLDTTEATISNIDTRLDADDVYYCELYPGGDIGAQCQAAYDAAVIAGDDGIILQLPNGNFTQTTVMDFCSEGENTDIPLILRGHGSGLAQIGGTSLRAGAGLQSTAISDTFTIAIGVTPPGETDGLPRGTITCATCDFVASGFRRGDLIETSGFSNATNNFSKSDFAGRTLQGGMPLKVYRATPTVLYVEDEIRTNPIAMIAETRAASVRKLQAQIELCSFNQYVRDIALGGDFDNNYADIGIHFKVDNAPVDGCVSAGSPFPNCGAAGTDNGTPVTSNIMVGGGASNIRTAYHNYGGVWLTALEQGGQADHFTIKDSYFGETMVQFWYDSLQAQPGPVVEDTQFEAMKRNGYRASSGSIQLHRSTLVSRDDDCESDAFGECWYVELLTNNTIGTFIRDNFFEANEGGAFKIHSQTTDERHVAFENNRVMANDEFQSDNTTPQADQSLVEIPGLCGILAFDANMFVQNRGPTNSATIDIQNSNQVNCPLTISGRSSVREQGPSNNIPTITIGSTLVQTAYSDSDMTWTGEHNFTSAGLQSPYKSDCSGDTSNGDLCVDSDDNTLYVMGAQVPAGADIVAIDGTLSTDGSGSFDKYLPVQTDPYLTNSVASPFTNGNYKMYSNFAFEGIKAVCMTDGLGLGVDGDPAKPWELDCVTSAEDNRVCVDSGDPYLCCTGEGQGSCGVGNIEKTKSTGLMLRQHVVTPGENFAQQLTQVTGGDSDSITLHIRQFSMGGSQTGGDEGTTNIRIVNQDYLWTAEGTATVPATTGQFDLTFTTPNPSLDHSVAVAEGKLIVFTGAEETQTVPSGDDTYRPGGTTKTNEAINAGYGAHLSNEFNWTLDTALPVGVEEGWCFTDTASAYQSDDGVTTHHWLRISGVNGTRTAFSTEYWSQSNDKRYPSYYQWSGSYKYAPCAHIVKPIYDSAPNEVYAAGARLYKTTTWDSGGSPVAFQIPAYGEHMMSGIRVISSSNLAVASRVYGFEAINNTSGTKGKFQHDAAYVASNSGTIRFDRSLSDLDDGNYHAWDAGLSCLDDGCRIGIKYEFQDGNQGNASAAISVDPPITTSNWGEGNGNYLTLIDVESESALELNLNHDQGLMQGQDPLIVESDIDTFAGLNGIVADETLTKQSDIDSPSELNGIVGVTLTQTIASGQQALGTAAIAANECSATTQVAATNVLSTDVLSVSFNGDPTGTAVSGGAVISATGYGPSVNDGLAIYAWPSAGNANFKVCNLTNANITPTAITLNYRVTR